MTQTQLEFDPWNTMWNMWLDKPKDTFKPTMEEYGRFMFECGRNYERSKMAGTGRGNIGQEQGTPIHT